MSDTPETNRRIIPDVKYCNDAGDSVYTDCVPAGLARKLERERDEARRASKILKKKVKRLNPWVDTEPPPWENE